MRLGSLTRPELIFLGLPAGDRSVVLRAFAEQIAAHGLVADPEELHRKLLEREQLGSTGIGSGVAIPHCKLKGLSHGVVALAVLDHGVDFGAADGQPVRLLFLVVSPSEAPAEHLQILAAISRWLKADRHVEKILGLRDREAIFQLLREES
jgi:PTS system nitrogen regulatory IIA component